MDSQIGLHSGLQLRVRLLLLYDVIQEFARALCVPERVIKVIEKGVLRKQLLSSIIIYYLKNEKEAVGSLSLNIDWDKHKVFASASTGEKVAIENDKPLLEQFAFWSSDIINYIELMQKELGVTDIKIRFKYIAEIYENPEKEKEADEYLGLRRAKGIPYANQIDAFERKMRFISNMLPELEIGVSSRSH